MNATTNRRRGYFAPAALALALALALLPGCAKHTNLLTSLHDMTSETATLGPPSSLLFYGTQYESLSLLGLLPAPAPGFMYCYNPNRGPNSAIGLSEYKSFYLTHSHGDDVTAADVLDVRDALEKTKDAMRQAAAAATALSLGLKQAMAAEIARKEAEAKAAEAAKKLAQDKAKAALEELAEATGSTPEGVAAAVAKPKPAEATPQGPDQKTLADLQAKSTNADKVFQDEVNKVNTLIAKSGVMVVRWVSAASDSAGGNLSKILAAESASNATRSGWAVIGGLRSSRLYVGRDILYHWAEVDNIGITTDWRQVVTMVLQTRNIAYLSDVNTASAQGASFSLDAEQAAKIAADWKKELSIQLSVYQAKMNSLGSLGFLGDDGRIMVHRAPWRWFDSSRGRFETAVLQRYEKMDETGKVLDKAIGETALDKDEKWITLYQATISLKALKELWE